MFAERIRQIRAAKNLSQSDFAEELGVSIDTLQRWENGKQSPRVHELGELAEKMGVTKNYLIGEPSNTFSYIANIPKENFLFFRNGEQELAIPNTPDLLPAFLELVEKMIKAPQRVQFSYNNQNQNTTIGGSNYGVN